MPPVLPVYFTFSSSYAYLAWHRLTKRHPERYASVAIDFRPINFLRLKELMGLPATPPVEQELAYNRVDAARWAAAYGIPFVGKPARRFGPTQDAVKGYLIAARQDPAVAVQWMERVFTGYRVQGEDISDRDLLARWADEVGVRHFATYVDSPQVNAALEANTLEALRSGAPGVPFAVLDGEGFWGNDRLAWLEARLAGASVPASF